MSSPAAPIFKKRNASSKLRKRAATPPSADTEDSSSSSSDDDEPGRQIKRQKKSATITSSTSKLSPLQDLSTNTKFASDRSTQLTTTDDATRTTRNFGPVKAPANVRTITVTDFAPDVCKDYKQTGFCGFGDSCKFLHAREDYKQGWELEKDWLKADPKSKKAQSTSQRGGKTDNQEEDEDSILENIPFACIICKRPYNFPIVTKCGHYFCESCALQRYRKTPSCAACGAGTGGVFNGAKGLKKLLDRKRERKGKAREVARERGEEVSSGEENLEGGEE
ncbi:MAG: hypothetical protein LQ346_007397 [Caloplaca aetnensis]|nr:MAG: hypothetical protein LQ346_007397 [Caloplaca aetnensis]